MNDPVAHTPRSRLALAALAVLVVPAGLVATHLAPFHTFTNGSVADATEVNGNFTAVHDELVALGTATAPTGSVVAFSGAVLPTGWLRADGSAVSRTTYAALFAAIGTTYGAGDGTTTFNLPYSGRTEVVRYGGASNSGIFTATAAPAVRFDPTKFTTNTSGGALAVDNSVAGQTRFKANGRTKVEAYFAAPQNAAGNYAMVWRNGAMAASGGHVNSAGYIESVQFMDLLVAGDYLTVGGSSGVSAAGDFVTLMVLATPEIPFAAIIKS